MDKILQNKQLTHIISEVIVLLGLTYYFSSKNKKLLQHIEELSHRLDEKDEQISSLEESVKQLITVCKNQENRFDHIVSLIKKNVPEPKKKVKKVEGKPNGNPNGNPNGKTNIKPVLKKEDTKAPVFHKKSSTVHFILNDNLFKPSLQEQKNNISIEEVNEVDEKNNVEMLEEVEEVEEVGENEEVETEEENEDGEIDISKELKELED
jgi:hypothetical protein